MKKIMFNDKFVLTQAVLEGRKTMTRRMCLDYDTGAIMTQDYKSVLYQPGLNRIQCYTGRGPIHYSKKAAYEIGEVVAVAQPYKSIFEESLNYALPRYHWLDDHIDEKGFANKMFVKAGEMPHQIRITDIKVERLQDINEEDCLREGIQAFDTPDGKVFVAGGVYVGQDTRSKIAKGMINLAKPFKTPQEAFAVLIDAVSGKGTWKSNPWVFAYEFELNNHA